MAPPASSLFPLHRLLVVFLALCVTLASPFAIHLLPRPSLEERSRHHSVRDTPRLAPLKSTLVPGSSNHDDAVVRAYTVEQQLREVDARIAEILRAKSDVERELKALDRRRRSLRSFCTRVKEAVQVPTRSFVRWIKGVRDNTLAAAGQA